MRTPRVYIRAAIKVYLNVLTLVSLLSSDHHFYFDRAKGEREVKEKYFLSFFPLLLPPSSKTELLPSQNQPTGGLIKQTDAFQDTEQFK